MQRVLVLDIETLPDLAAGRALLDMPEAEEEAVRAALGARYARPGEAPERAFLKPPLHRLCCLGLLVAERAAPDEPWRVARLRARTVAEEPEAALLARFDAALRGGPGLIGFNTGGFDLPVLRYRALTLGVPMPHLHAPGFAYLHRFGERHLDLMDRLSGFRASPAPSLGECAALLGLSLKAEIDGERVEALWAAGEHARIAAYCRTDLAATWLLALRWWMVTGGLPPERARESLRGFAEAIAEGALGEGLEAIAAAARAAAG
ncbi:3'-5' exonuclease [Rubritepida flocculans]|uniref:3'-5' exonuclease n=1 Tax=Rubritepida flocculans TaxID=182403 RepID=UPI000410F3F8|nr:3'-5' exonuclease [Rubritepida flocculans]